MNKFIFTGNLGRDPQMRYTPQGKAVTNFNVAVPDGYGERKKTIWVKVAAWGNTAEACNQYLKKGSKVLVEGTLVADDNGNPKTFQTNSGETRASFEVNAISVEFLSSRTQQEPTEDELQF